MYLKHPCRLVGTNKNENCPQDFLGIGLFSGESEYASCLTKTIDFRKLHLILSPVSCKESGTYYRLLALLDVLLRIPASARSCCSGAHLNAVWYKSTACLIFLSSDQNSMQMHDYVCNLGIINQKGNIYFRCALRNHSCLDFSFANSSKNIP